MALDVQAGELTQWPLFSLLDGGFAELFLGEVEEDLPVALGHRMFAGADVIAKGTVDQFVIRRHLVGIKATDAEQTIDGLGRLEHLELSLWIGPGVLDRVAEQNRPWIAESGE